MMGITIQQLEELKLLIEAQKVADIGMRTKDFNAGLNAAIAVLDHLIRHKSNGEV